MPRGPKIAAEKMNLFHETKRREIRNRHKVSQGVPQGVKFELPNKQSNKEGGSQSPVP
jgi:hypothetical protein